MWLYKMRNGRLKYVSSPEIAELQGMVLKDRLRKSDIASGCRASSLWINNWYRCKFPASAWIIFETIKWILWTNVCAYETWVHYYILETMQYPNSGGTMVLPLQRCNSCSNGGKVNGFHFVLGCKRYSFNWLLFKKKNYHRRVLCKFSAQNGERITEKRPGLAKKKIIFRQDNARSHTSYCYGKNSWITIWFATIWVIFTRLSAIGLPPASMSEKIPSRPEIFNKWRC